MKNPFKLRSGNAPLFKYIGSTPIKAAKVKAKTKTKTKTEKLGSDILRATEEAYTKTPDILYKSGLETGLEAIAALEDPLEVGKFIKSFKKKKGSVDEINRKIKSEQIYIEPSDREYTVPIYDPNKNRKTKVEKAKVKNLGVNDSMSFSKAFRTARNKHGGKGGTFTWKGKKYHTGLGSEK